MLVVLGGHGRARTYDLGFKRPLHCLLVLRALRARFAWITHWFDSFVGAHNNTKLFIVHILAFHFDGFEAKGAIDATLTLRWFFYMVHNWWTSAELNCVLPVISRMH